MRKESPFEFLLLCRKRFLRNNKLEARNRTISRQKAMAAQRRVVAKQFGNKLVARTKRVAAAGVAAIPAESLPIIGISVVVAGTAYELYEACESMKDLKELYAGLDIAEDLPGDVLGYICKPGFSTPL